MRRSLALIKKSLKNKRAYRPRRIWTLSQKLDLLERARRVGSSMSAVARESDVDVRLLFQWRRDLQEGHLAQRTWGEPGKRQRLKAARGTADTTCDGLRRLDRHEPPCSTRSDECL